MSKEETFTLEEIEELCHHAFRWGKGGRLIWEEYKYQLESELKKIKKSKTNTKGNFNMLKRRNNDNNPATEKINNKNNTTMENNITDNPTWTGNWVWTDDKVKEAINYITHLREVKHLTEGWIGIDYHLKEFKLNDWFNEIGLKKDRIFESNDEEVIMTSGELKQLIDLLRNHS